MSDKCAVHGKYHNVYAEWEDCQTDRMLDGNLERWARDMADVLDTFAVRDEVLARLERWVRMV